MCKCPKCGKEIDRLEYKIDVSGTEEGTYDLENTWEKCDEDLNFGDVEFICPKCFEIICNSEEEAIKLLRGKKEE
jgi:hypothetical protein